MSYRLAEQDKNRIRVAIDLLEMSSNALQNGLLNVKRYGGPAVVDIASVGELLALSRNIDTLERVCSELSAMLNRPPDEPTPAQEEPA